MRNENTKMLHIYSLGIAVGVLIIMLFKDKELLIDLKDGLYIVLFYKWIGNYIAIVILSAIAEAITMLFKRRSWNYESYVSWSIIIFILHLLVNLFT